MKARNGNLLVMGILVASFIIYSSVLYFGKNTSASSAPKMSENALLGEKIWQENNCTACHQLYGLGGYLGPDLTNIVSNPFKGPEYAKAFFNSGIKSMPAFDFTENEKNALVDFLTHVDATGYYPNHNAKFGPDGWVSIEYK